MENLLLTGPVGGRGHASRGHPGRSRQCAGKETPSMAGLGLVFIGGFLWSALGQGQSVQCKPK